MTAGNFDCATNPHPNLTNFAREIYIRHIPGIFSCIFKALEILGNRVGARESLNLCALVLEIGGIFLACNSVLCGYSYCCWLHNLTSSVRMSSVN